MSEHAGTQSDPIRIRDGERQVVLHPENDDLFVRTGRQVIEACRLEISLELWLSELGAMLDHVREWSARQDGKVRACFAEPRGARIKLLFVPTSRQFDFDLADQMTELNSQLVQRYNVGMVEVGQVPWQELDRFVDFARARLVYGEQPTAH